MLPSELSNDASKDKTVQLRPRLAATEGLMKVGIGSTVASQDLTVVLNSQHRASKF